MLHPHLFTFRNLISSQSNSKDLSKKILNKLASENITKGNKKNNNNNNKVLTVLSK